MNVTSKFCLGLVAVFALTLTAARCGDPDLQSRRDSTAPNQTGVSKDEKKPSAVGASGVRKPVPERTRRTAQDL